MTREAILAGAAIAAIAAARIVYNAFLSPYELVADEAQYWDWSRHLDWSYYSKGPGIAWVIAGVTRVLGDAEWAIRLPAVLSFAIVMLALSWLTADGCRSWSGGRRAVVFVPFLVALVPAYQLSSILMTIDAPYLACWAVALAAAWRTYCTERDAKPRYGPWILLGAAIGVGFLFKYTALLLVPGLLAFAWLERRDVRWRLSWRRALVAASVMTLSALPVVVWNARHQAAGLDHLSSYLTSSDWGWIAWLESLVEYPVVQIGVIGPVLLLALAGGRLLARIEGHATFVRFACWSALPTLAFFLMAALRTRIEGNWPMPAFLSLVPLAAVCAASGQARRSLGGVVVYGAVTLAIVHMPLAAARAPGFGHLVPVSRFTGARAVAGAVEAGVDQVVTRSTQPLLLVATSHNWAGLLTYYLPDHPVVASAGRVLGLRPSAYDFFEDTDLTRQPVEGRPALLVGGSLAMWNAAFDCRDLQRVDGQAPLFYTSAFRERK